MKKIENGKHLEELINNTKTIKKKHTNNIFFSCYFNNLINENRLYFQLINNNDLIIYIDEGKYFRIIFYVDNVELLNDIYHPKTTLIELINNDKLKNLMDQYNCNVLRTNYMFEKEVNNDSEQKELNDFIIKINDSLDNAIELWDKYLDITDIPLSHRTLNNDDKIVNIYNLKDEVCATYWWTRNRFISEGRHLVTHEDYYRQGLASYLIDLWHKDCKDNSIVKMRTWINNNNQKSMSLFEKKGFVRVNKCCYQFIKY